MNRLDHRFCIPSMMDWTDRHCRFFHRLLTRACAALHGDDNGGGGPARQAGHAARVQRRGAPGRAAARRLRSGQARRGRRDRRGLRLRRDQPQRRLPVGSRAGGPLRRLPDGGARAGGALRGGDARHACRCRSPSSAASASTIRTARRTSSGSFPLSRPPAAAPSSCMRARRGCRGCRPRRTARSRRSTTARVYRLKAAHPELEIVINGGIALAR